MTKRIVNIRQTRARLEIPDGQTILEAALAAGISYPHGCRSGRCGSCKSRLIEGKVQLLQHSRFALTEEEKSDGLILACCALPQTDAAVAWLDSDDEAVVPPRCLDAIVTGLDDLTHDIKLVRVTPADSSPLLFTAGQYARIGFIGTPVRSYSMANRERDGSLEFHIRRVAGGIASEHIHGVLKTGDKVELEFPLGSSYLRKSHSGPMLCIAGGSGLAPIKSIVETALANGMKQPIHVYHGVRNERDLYLIKHFQTLAEQYANLTFVVALSEAETTQYRRGFVTKAVADDLVNLDGWKAYVAGPPAMIGSAIQLALARGLRGEDIHADVFFTPDDRSLKCQSNEFDPGSIPGNRA